MKSNKETNEWATRKSPEAKFKNKVWYEGYDDLFPLRRQFYSDAVFKYNPKSVLEVGCCGGANIAFFPKDKKTKIIGIDINSDAIKYAESTKPGPKYYHHDIIEPFSFLKSKVDIVCSMGVLIHIRPNTIDTVLTNMLNTCSKGLVLIETFGSEKSMTGSAYPQFIHNIPERIKNIDSSVEIKISKLEGEIDDVGATASSLCLIEIMK
jgi:2-polyprenyl-3-methyl-5-hydroxy-6-metoxy-1,4-benzoquinol methylase